MSEQYLRKVSLIVSNNKTGIDLSNLRIIFQISAADTDRPPTAIIKIYNLSGATSKTIQTEFSEVVLQAGYENGNFGIIFAGTIKMIRRGRENASTSFLQIFAADGDEAFNLGVVNASLAAGNTSWQDQFAVISKGLNAAGGVTPGINQLPGSGGILPRGKVLYGMAKYQLNSLTQSTVTTWFIDDGQVHVLTYDGYRPGQAVVLTAKTGLVGIPEATQQGIVIRCLINPFIKVGGLVKLDNASINTTQVNQQGFPEYTGINFFASTDNDGFYRVLCIDAIGDTRGMEWYYDLTCLQMDPSTTGGPTVINGPG